MSTVKSKIAEIVKHELVIGMAHDTDNLVEVHHADAEDMIQIIDEIEREFGIEFNDKEHFDVKSIKDMTEVTLRRINESNIP